jgi:hypothetical protein
LEVELFIYSVDELDKDREEFRIKIEDPIPGTKDAFASVRWDAIEPEKTSEQPFSVDQMKFVIPPKSHIKLTVSYSSEEIRTFNSVIVAKPKFYVEPGAVDEFGMPIEAPDFKLDELSVRLKGETFLPKIDLIETLSKKQISKIPLKKKRKIVNNFQ